MKTIIAGTRTLEDEDIIFKAIELSGFDITEVVCGDCRGVDKKGEEWAKDNGIPVSHFKAYWEHFGDRAGPLRNQEMAEYADALIAVWNGTSTGTKDMIKKAKISGLKIYVYNILEERIKETENKKSEKELSDLGFEY